MHLVKVFFATLPAFLLLDFIWLGLLMPKFYSDSLGNLARRSGDALDPNWTAAVFVYIIIVLGLVLFVLPKMEENSPWSLLVWGAAFGVILYGVYDLTNLSTLAGWSLKLTIVDMVWGGVACGIASVAMGYMSNWLK